MNKRKLNRVFAKIRTECGLDYAVVNSARYADSLDSPFDIYYGIQREFPGKVGIYVNWYPGINRGVKIDNLDHVNISRNISPEQAVKMVKILKKSGYDVEPDKYVVGKCFAVREKEE